MKLFIYYSETGNGDMIANYLKDKGFEIRKISPIKKLPKLFFFKMMVGGFEAGMKKKRKLQEYDKDISKYEEIYIGSPIWNDRLSSIVNTLLSDLDLANKKVTFVLYSGGGKANHALKRLNEEYKDAKVIILKQPKTNVDELKKLD